MSSAAERIGGAVSPRFGRIVRLFADPVSALGLAIVLLIVLCALFAPLIAPYDPAHIDVTEKLRPPSPAHWFGTDQLGRDLLSRIVHGARTALSIAFVSTLLAGTVGLMLGMIAGYGPRWLDGLMVLLFDSMNALPMIMFALAVITVLGGGTATLILVIVLTSMPAYARLVRAQTLALKNSEFIIAERSLGAGPVRIVLVHLLPNVVGPLAILLSMDVPVIIMVEAGLSFLGLGVRPPTPSWGSILYDSYANLRRAPSMVVFGGLPLVLATLGFTFLGEALRDALDSRLQFRRSL